jgi:hypothetical protein
MACFLYNFRDILHIMPYCVFVRTTHVCIFFLMKIEHFIFYSQWPRHLTCPQVVTLGSYCIRLRNIERDPGKMQPFRRTTTAPGCPVYHSDDLVAFISIYYRKLTDELQKSYLTVFFYC